MTGWCGSVVSGGGGGLSDAGAQGAGGFGLTDFVRVSDLALVDAFRGALRGVRSGRSVCDVLSDSARRTLRRHGVLSFGNRWGAVLTPYGAGLLRELEESP